MCLGKINRIQLQKQSNSERDTHYLVHALCHIQEKLMLGKGIF